MSTLVLKQTEHIATNVQCDEFSLRVTLMDGREISVPLEWFPRLRNANQQQKNNWRFIGRGIGIHWEDIDEDILVNTLLN